MANKSALDYEGNLWLEIIVRIILSVTFLETEHSEPFQRKIHAEELWLYKNPRTSSYVPVKLLWPIVIFVPASFIIFCCVVRKDKRDTWQAMLSFSLALGLNGIITNIMKLLVGRPRPDFFWRCFPDGQANDDMNCTGNVNDVIDGYKSFPSGHSSFAFVSMGFTSLYLAGKLHCFNWKGRGQSWRFCFMLSPLLLALMIALSRTADYHHHWQDVLVGSLIGATVSYVCYHQYYPSLEVLNCDLPLAVLANIQHSNIDDENPKELESVKWI